MAEMTNSLARAIFEGAGATRHELEQLAFFWLIQHGEIPGPAAASLTRFGPRVPSRFQIGDEVRAMGERGVVRGVTFAFVEFDAEYMRGVLAELGIPDRGDYKGVKVMYDVEVKGVMRMRVMGDFVEPYLPPRLHLVAAANEGEASDA